jgi:hypothetical protein
MSTAIQSAQESILLGVQSAKGTETTKYYKFRVLSGFITSNPAIERQAILDGKRWRKDFSWINELPSAGTVTVQCGADAFELLTSWKNGAVSSVDNLDGTTTYTITPSDGEASYVSAVASLGEGTAALRGKFLDGQIGSLRFTASAGSKVLTAEIGLNFLQPAKHITADPSSTELETPLLYTDGEGSFEIDGTHYGSITGWELAFDEDRAPYQGDGLNYRNFAPGKANITWGWTFATEDENLPILRKYLYGTATPSAGADPVPAIQEVDATITLSKGTGADLREITLDSGAHELIVTDWPEGQADGGVTTFACTGQADPDAFTVTITHATPA